MGAWGSQHGFYELREPVMAAEKGTLLACAILALKHELAYVGFKGTMNVDKPAFGRSVDAAVRTFQFTHGLVVDGVVGPVTAEALFRQRVVMAQEYYTVPDSLAGRIIKLESAFDPGAQGWVDPEDYGLVQAHLPFFPSFSLAQVVKPSWCIPYLCRTLRDRATTLGGDWDVAVASWNVGLGGAKLWVAAGKPGLGGTRDFPDLYARATNYVALVRARSF